MTIESFRPRVMEICTEWLDDPDTDKRRQGAKELLPYLWSKRAAVSMRGEINFVPLDIMGTYKNATA